MTEKEFTDGFVDIYSRRLAIVQELLRCNSSEDKTVTLSPDQLTEIIHHSFVAGWSIGLALETIDNDAVKFLAAKEFLKLYAKQMSQFVPMEIRGL